MDENIVTVTPRKRITRHTGTANISLTIPEFLLDLVDQEAKERGETRSKVAAYLIFCGLKAHTGDFLYPSKNTIKANYLKRGKTWRIQQE